MSYLISQEDAINALNDRARYKRLSELLTERLAKYEAQETVAWIERRYERDKLVKEELKLHETPEVIRKNLEHHYRLEVVELIEKPREK